MSLFLERAMLSRGYILIKGILLVFALEMIYFQAVVVFVDRPDTDSECWRLVS